MMEQVSCNLCGSERRTVFSARGEHYNGERNVICRDCGLVYTSPRMDGGEAWHFYAEEYRHLYSGSSMPTDAILCEQRLRAQCRFDFLRARCQRRPGRAFEVGCAAGSFLELLRETGWQSWGVEPSLEFSSYARNRLGLAVATGVLEEVSLALGAYDLVCMFHVLEHLRDPTAALEKMASALAPQGNLFLEVPDVQRASLNLDRYFHKAHLYNFSRDTLAKLLAKTGFAVAATAYDEVHSKNLMVWAERDERARQRYVILPGERGDTVLRGLRAKRRQFRIGQLRGHPLLRSLRRLSVAVIGEHRFHRMWVKVRDGYLTGKTS